MQLSPTAIHTPIAPVLVAVLRAAAGIAQDRGSKGSDQPEPPAATPPPAGAQAAPADPSSVLFRSRTPPPVALPRGIQVANPVLDAIVERQQRFRIVGDGPVSQRQVLPATAAVASAVAKDPRPVDAVRRMLQLVEDVAGGPEQSTAVRLHGISFSDSPQGLAANTYRAQLDDNVELQRAWAGHGRWRMERNAAAVGAKMVEETRGAHANVVSGWLNLGHVASETMLGGGLVSGRAQADAVRVLAHEAVHLVDPAPAGLGRDADIPFIEARAEARSTSLPQLQAARRALGFDVSVSDADLAASLAIRPYVAAELLLAQAHDAAGIVPGTPEHASIGSLTNAEALARIVERASARSGWSHGAVRDALRSGFASTVPAAG